MKRRKFSEEQIAFALRQAEAGSSVEEVFRKLGSRADVLPVEEAVCRHGVPEIRRLKQLQDEEQAAQAASG